MKPLGFPCPKCGAATLVAAGSSAQRMNGTVYRRRQCKDCGHRFATKEMTTADDAQSVAERHRERWERDRQEALR